jgi:sporulation protein YlmC with PRC-barrel domain
MSRRTWIVFATTAAILSTSVATLSAEAARPLGTLPAEAATITDYYRQNVYDPADQEIGEIVDLVIEKEGQVPATMISVGSFLALTKKIVAIPFSALQVTLKEHKPYLVLDIDKRALRNAPGFEFNRSERRWQRVEEEQ